MVFLKLWHEALGSSRVATGLREPLLLPQGIQVSFRVARGSAGFLSRHCRGIGPPLTVRGESHDVS